MKEESKRFLRGLFRSSVLCSVVLFFYTYRTGCSFESGWTWGLLTPFAGLLASNAYCLHKIIQSEIGWEDNKTEKNKNNIRTVFATIALIGLIYIYIPNIN